MLMALAWLTVCLPYVNENREAIKAQVEKIVDSSEETNTGNPLTNTTEEKSESGASLLSDYLHNLYLLDQHSTIIASLLKYHSFELYHAFHPDLIIPPPER